MASPSLTQSMVTSSHCPDEDDGKLLQPPLVVGLGCSHLTEAEGRPLLLPLRWALEAMVDTGLCD